MSVPTVIRIAAFLEVQPSAEVPTLIEKPASLRTLVPEEPVLVGVQVSEWGLPPWELQPPCGTGLH